MLHITSHVTRTGVVIKPLSCVTVSKVSSFAGAIFLTKSKQKYYDPDRGRGRGRARARARGSGSDTDTATDNNDSKMLPLCLL